MRILLISLLVILYGCGSVGDDVVIHRIPGTELAATKSALATVGRSGAITVSPDEQWLLFWQWLHHPKERSNDRSLELGMTLVSLNLETGEQTSHTLGGFPYQAIRAKDLRSAWARVGIWFDAAGWNGGLCYVDMPPGSSHLVIDPTQPPIAVAKDLPDGHRTCSDCPPTAMLRQRLGPRATLDDYSIAWHDGTLGKNIYNAGQEATIYRITSDGTHEQLLQKKARNSYTTVSKIRVSPNERYLAYAVYSKKEFLIPLPDHREDIYVLDLEANSEKRIATHRFVSNLIWSGDSKRLYFAGSGKSGDDPGVYVVDVEATFSK